MNKVMWGLACVLVGAAVLGCKGRSGQTTQPSSGPTTTQGAGQKVYRPGGRGLAGIFGPASEESYKPVVGKYGGRIVLAALGEPKTFNPIVANERSSTDITALMWEGLTTSNPWTADVQANLATRWTHDKSGLVWTVRLRDGLVWSDGVPLTADDVLFTYKTIYDPKVSAPMRDLLTGPKGEQWKLEKIDDQTIRFVLFDKNAVFPQLIAQPIIPKHAVIDVFFYIFPRDNNFQFLISQQVFSQSTNLVFDRSANQLPAVVKQQMNRGTIQHSYHRTVQDKQIRVTRHLPIRQSHLELHQPQPSNLNFELPDCFISSFGNAWIRLVA